MREYKSVIFLRKSPYKTLSNWTFFKKIDTSFVCPTTFVVLCWKENWKTFLYNKPVMRLHILMTPTATECWLASVVSGIWLLNLSLCLWSSVLPCTNWYSNSSSNSEFWEREVSFSSNSTLLYSTAFNKCSLFIDLFTSCPGYALDSQSKPLAESGF